MSKKLFSLMVTTSMFFSSEVFSMEAGVTEYVLHGQTFPITPNSRLLIEDFEKKHISTELRPSHARSQLGNPEGVARRVWGYKLDDLIKALKIAKDSDGDQLYALLMEKKIERDTGALKEANDAKLLEDQQQIEKLNEELKKMRVAKKLEIATLKDEIKAITAKMNELSTNHSSVLDAKRNLEDKLDVVQQEKNALQNELEEAGESADEISKQLDEKVREIAELQASLLEQQELESYFVEQKQEMESNFDTLRAELLEAKVENNKMKHEKSLLAVDHANIMKRIALLSPLKTMYLSMQAKTPLTRDGSANRDISTDGGVGHLISLITEPSALISTEIGTPIVQEEPGAAITTPIPIQLDQDESSDEESDDDINLDGAV